MKKKNMNNLKGFTLIELMAVIIILAIIGLIVFPSAIESINNSKDKLYKEQVKRILNAADSWASSNDSKLPSNNGEAIIVTINELQEAGLLKKDDVKNPLSGSENMSQEIVIYYDRDYNQYVSGYCDSEYWDKYYNSEEYEVIKNKCDGNHLVICKPIIGDLDNNGILDDNDVNLLRGILANDDGNMISISDIDGDGILSNKDVTVFMKVIESGVKPGDVNDDGLVNNTDLELVLDYIVGKDVSINRINADMNCDGKITNSDAILIRRIIENY